MQALQQEDSLSHVDRPDARPTAQVEDAGLPMLRDGGEVQFVSPRNKKQLVVDVHAVLLRLHKGLERAGGRSVRRAALTSSQGYM